MSDCQTVVQALGHVGAGVGAAVGFSVLYCGDVIGRSIGLWVRNGVGGVGRGVGHFFWRLSANSC